MSDIYAVTADTTSSISREGKTTFYSPVANKSIANTNRVTFSSNKIMFTDRKTSRKDQILNMLIAGKNPLAQKPLTQVFKKGKTSLAISTQRGLNSTNDSKHIRISSNKNLMPSKISKPSSPQVRSQQFGKISHKSILNSTNGNMVETPKNEVYSNLAKQLKDNKTLKKLFLSQASIEFNSEVLSPGIKRELSICKTTSSVNNSNLEKKNASTRFSNTNPSKRSSITEPVKCITNSSKIEDSNGSICFKRPLLTSEGITHSGVANHKIKSKELSKSSVKCSFSNYLEIANSQVDGPEDLHFVNVGVQQNNKQLELKFELSGMEEPYSFEDNKSVRTVSGNFYL